MKTCCYCPEICILAIICLCLSGPVCHAAESAGPHAKELPEQRDARMEWFRQARFGMFIHWGLYSVAAGEWEDKPTPGAGEWIMADRRIPVSQYQKLVPQFNPAKFNAREWVRSAKDAGMKYMVITSKHHDGFALYPSALTDWCIKSTPFQRDPLKELADACREEGMTFCFYYSIMDWHHPAYAPRPAWNDLAQDPPDFDRYVTFMKGQLKELLTGYGPIGILWFDGCWEPTWTRQRGKDLYEYVRSLQPDIIVNNRVGSTSGWEQWFQNPEEVGGDYGTPEQQIPVRGFGPGVDWETCMTMNGTWGFKKEDHNWKSTEILIRNLVDIASKGGNYLLNVGPTAEGLIPEPSVERLKEIGRWMQVNGQAIYGTTASPFPRQLPWGRCTKKTHGDTTTLYLHVFNWPEDGELLLPGLRNKVEKAWVLTDVNKSPLVTNQKEEGVIVSLPGTPSDTISSTVVVQVTGPLRVEEVPITQRHDGSITLPAAEARLHGNTFRYESGGPLDDIGYWTDPADWADWEFKVHTSGKFTVSAIIAAPVSGSFDIVAGKQSIRCASPVTANYVDFQPVTLGVLEIPTPGQATLAVRPVREGWQPMNVKSIKLTPASPDN